MARQRNRSALWGSEQNFLDHPGFLTRLAQQRSIGIFAEIFKDQNFTATQHMTLIAIGEIGPTSQRRLSKYRSMEPSNLHVVLKTLSRRNLIDISVDPANKRRSRIDLTAEGRRALIRLDALDKQVSQLYLSPLTDQEQVRFKELLYKVAFDERDASGPE